MRAYVLYVRFYVWASCQRIGRYIRTAESIHYLVLIPLGGVFSSLTAPSIQVNAFNGCIHLEVCSIHHDFFMVKWPASLSICDQICDPVYILIHPHHFTAHLPNPKEATSIPTMTYKNCKVLYLACGHRTNRIVIAETRPSSAPEPDHLELDSLCDDCQERFENEPPPGHSDSSRSSRRRNGNDFRALLRGWRSRGAKRTS